MLHNYISCELVDARPKGGLWGLSPISAYVVAADKCSGQAVLLFTLLRRGGGPRLCLVDCKMRQSLAPFDMDQ